MKKIVFFLLVIALFPVNIVLASQTEQPLVNDSTFSLFIKLIFYLGFVLLLIYLFFWLMAKKNKGMGNSLYNHLGGLPLGQNKSLQIVEIGGKIYILGVGDNVQLIRMLEDEEELKAISESIQLDEFEKRNFKKIFRIFSRKNISAKSQFEQELAEKIEQLKEKRFKSVNQLFENSSKDVNSKDSEQQ